MRKRLIVPETARAERDADDWLDLDRIAEVELTSEDDAYPIESALSGGGGAGWRAAEPGEQLVRIVFDEPRRLERVRLVFEEPEAERRQEFALRWSPDLDAPARDVVRQQWNFSPPDSTREVEEYHLELAHVKLLELAIVPDVSGGPARASLRSLRVA